MAISIISSAVTISVLASSVAYAATAPVGSRSECVIQDQVIDCSCGRGQDTAHGGKLSRCRDDRIHENTSSMKTVPIEAALWMFDPFGNVSIS
jgi:hypothetical protein